MRLLQFKFLLALILAGMACVNLASAKISEAPRVRVSVTHVVGALLAVAVTEHGTGEHSEARGVHARRGSCAYKCVGGSVPNPEIEELNKFLVEASPVGDVKTLLSPTATGLEKAVAGVKLAATLIPVGRIAGAAEGVGAATRGLEAADLGLSGRGITALEGTITNAGTTRIIDVANIEARTGSLLPELRGALPNILNSARAGGVQTLQVTASFANPGLRAFAASATERLGGTFSSVGGQEILTFILGAP